MRKLIYCLILSLNASVAMAAINAQVFVSFSMPEQLLTETLMSSARLHIPALLNGLIDNSMPKTIKRIASLTQTIPNLNLQIDPTAFEKFRITQVPALVVDNGVKFDVLYGNLALEDGLSQIADRGETGFSIKDFKSLTHE